MSSIMRWNPFREMAAMQSALDRLFEDTWRGVWPTTAGNALALDVHETDTAYTVVTALPGLSAEQISVRFDDGNLIISAEIPQPQPAEGTKVLLQERPFGQFTRSLRLPQTIDVNQVEATYENGLLTLTLPKTPEVQPKQIPVKAGGNLLPSKN